MENRFGIKDLFIFVFLIGLLIAVVLAMVQFDRQYREILNLKQQQSELTRGMATIQRQLAAGVAIGGGTGTGIPVDGLEVFKPLVAAEKTPGYAQGDWLIDNFGTKVGKLTPLIGGDLYQRIVESRVCESLATRDPETTKFIPLLAESWDIKDNSAAWEAYVKPMRDKGMTPDQISAAIKKDSAAPTATEITFKLRRGVLFSDARPMTSEDVVFTFEWILNPKINAPRERSYLDKLKTVKANGSYEVTFTFTEPYFMSFETVASTSVMSKAFYSRFTPDEYNEKTGLLIGTGPYKLENPENWTPGTPIKLVRNNLYWGVQAPFDQLIFREVEDESAEETMFKNGELDIFACVPEQYENLLKNAEVVKRSHNLKYNSPLNGYIYIGWNQRRKIGGTEQPTMFNDKRVRQAMTLLIDRDRICKDVFLGYGTTATGPFDPDSPQTNPDIKPWPFDEKRGKELLAEAGYKDRNGDGVIDGPDGQPFRFKLSYPSGSATYQRVVLFLKDSFARAGITMEPDPLDFPVLLDRIKRNDFDACSLGWGGTVESDCYQIFHSSQIADQGDNRTQYVSAECDRLIEEARKTIDDDARMKIWQKVHAVLHEDQPYTFLMNRPSLVFINGRIQNVKPTKLGLNYLRLYPNPIPWYVPAQQQRYTK